MSSETQAHQEWVAIENARRTEQYQLNELNEIHNHAKQTASKAIADPTASPVTRQLAADYLGGAVEGVPPVVRGREDRGRSRVGQILRRRSSAAKGVR